MACTNNSLKKSKLAREKKLNIIYGDVTLGLHGTADGKEFHYIFSRATGGMESLSVQGREWLYRTPCPTFWRATTDNDRGNGFPLRSGMWLSADMFIRRVESQIRVDGEDIPFPVGPENNKYTGNETAEKVEIIYTYETITNPKTQIKVSYLVDSNGEIRVNVYYYGQQGLPELPVFGLRMIMPTCADKYVYEGLSGETYPDRMAGGEKGIYEISGLPVTPYLVPQDCGMHMNTRSLTVYRSTELDNTHKEKQTTSLRFELDGLAFSCLPYTACELENATHMEELPPARRTVLCIYGAVRGVGGIDSWGSDVEPAYRISGEKDISYSFRICVQ